MSFNEDMDTQNWVSEFKTIDKLSEQLQFIIVLLYSQPQDIQELFDADIKKFEDIWNNLKFMRRVKHRDSLISDYATEYFGMDYGETDPFHYKKHTEKNINDISLEIMGVLGRLIKVNRDRRYVIPDEA